MRELPGRSLPGLPSTSSGAGGVPARECREGGQPLLEGSTGFPGERHGVLLLHELPVAVGEHRVVQGVLRVEVLVQRRLAHLDLSRRGVQRDTADPVLLG
jgi:hypothetical protein